jgi:hypothetical protein
LPQPLSWKSYDAEYYARALDWIIEINANLPDGDKIRAVCFAVNPENPDDITLSAPLRPYRIFIAQNHYEDK